LGSQLSVSARQIQTGLRSITGYAHPTMGGGFSVDCIPAFLASGGLPVPNWMQVRDDILAELGWHLGGVDAARAARVAVDDALPGVAPVGAVGAPGAAAGAAPLLIGPILRDRLAASLKELKITRRRVERWKAKAIQRGKTIKDLEDTLHELKSAGKVGKTQSRFSPKSGLAMAIRRNMVNAPCDAMGLVISADVSRWTCARWEAILDNCLRGACRKAHAEATEFVRVLGGFAIHSIMTDATNARLWHQQKVLVGEYASMYLFKPEASEGDAPCEGFFFKYLGDLQIQSDGTAKAVRRMMFNQARSIGFPFWTDAIRYHGQAPRVDAGDAAGKLEDRFEEQLRLKRAAIAASPSTVNPLHVDAYCHSTDGGSDQRAARKLISAECMLCLFVWVLHGDCVNHQGHLCHKNGLKVTEWVLKVLMCCSVGYFSALAKTINTWRERGRKIYYTFVDLFGPVEAAQVAKSAPARCLVGRWGSEMKSAERLLNIPDGHLSQAFDKINSKRSAPKRPSANDILLAEHREDEIEHQRKQAGKWFTEALLALKACEWWLVMRISYKARQPFTHLHTSIQKYSSLAGTGCWANVGYIALLVWGKAKEHMQEFEALCKKIAWADVLGRRATVSDAANANLEVAIVILVLNAAAEYDSRLYARTRTFPDRWLILAKKPHNDVCTERQAVCGEILDAFSEFLEINTLKLRVIFKNELKDCRNTGKLDRHLWQFVYNICLMFRSNTQSIEGLNSLLKNMIRGASSIGQKLASYRMSIKHALGGLAANGTFCRKYNVCAPHAENMLHEALESMTTADAILEIDHRWGEPPDPDSVYPPAAVPLPSRLPDPALARTPAMQFATEMNWWWHLSVVEGNDGLGSLLVKCITMGQPAQLRSVCWVTTTMSNRLGHLLRCTMVSDTELKVDIPFVFRPSVDLFCDFWGVKPVPSMFAHNIKWRLGEETFFGELFGETHSKDMDDYWAADDRQDDDSVDMGGGSGCDRSDHSEGEGPTPPPRRRRRGSHGGAGGAGGAGAAPPLPAPASEGGGVALVVAAAAVPAPIFDDICSDFEEDSIPEWAEGASGDHLSAAERERVRLGAATDRASLDQRLSCADNEDLFFLWKMQLSLLWMVCPPLVQA